MRDNSKSTSDTEREAALNSAYHSVFEMHVLGQQVFDDLWRRFVSRSRVHTDGGIDAILKTYEAAAQRDVLEYIVKRINRHNGINDGEMSNEQAGDSEAYSSQ